MIFTWMNAAKRANPVADEEADSATKSRFVAVDDVVVVVVADRA